MDSVKVPERGDHSLVTCRLTGILPAIKLIESVFGRAVKTRYFVKEILY